MDKAKRSVRRSAARLTSSDDVESALTVALTEWRGVNNGAENFANLQRDASEYLIKWSVKEDNRVIKDSVCQLNELIGMWTEMQMRFGQQIGLAIDELDNIRQTQKAVRDAERCASALAGKEEKIKKDLQSALLVPWKKGGDVSLLQHKLQKIFNEREIAERHVVETKNEQEIIKMMRFKMGMNKLAHAYLDMGRACTHVFEAYRDITDQMPDGGDSRTPLPLLQYDRAHANRRVEMARRRVSEIVMPSTSPSNASIEERRRVSDTAAQQRRVGFSPTSAAFACFGLANRPSSDFAEPPPPYSP